jgi:hypothetical protein
VPSRHVESVHYVSDIRHQHPINNPIAGMYQPHQNPRARGGMSSPPAQEREGGSLLDELDKMAPIKSFDAFPKVQSTYTAHSRRGGILTVLVSLAIFLLVLVS